MEGNCDIVFSVWIRDLQTQPFKYKDQISWFIPQQHYEWQTFQWTRCYRLVFCISHKLIAKCISYCINYTKFSSNKTKDFRTKLCLAARDYINYSDKNCIDIEKQWVLMDRVIKYEECSATSFVTIPLGSLITNEK